MRQGEFRTGAWECRWRDISPWLEQGDLHPSLSPRQIVNARISQLCVSSLSSVVVAQKVPATLGRHQPVFLQNVTE